MEIKETRGVMGYKDKDGNLGIHYPVTEAELTTYNNEKSGLDAGNIQEALDEIAKGVETPVNGVISEEDFENLPEKEKNHGMWVVKGAGGGGGEPKIAVPVPTFTQTLTYNTNVQTPEFDNDPGSLATKSGDLTGLNAGGYTTRFTLNDPSLYEWDDGEPGEYRDVAWSIGKKEPTLSASPASLTLDNSNLTATATIITDGDGELSVESSDTSVVTADIADKLVSARHVDKTNGSATLTVTLAEGTNYTGKTLEIPVTAEFGPRVSTNEIPGVSYSNGITGLSTLQLNEIAEAISNNSEITMETSTVYFDYNTTHRKISIGDTMSGSVGGVSCSFRIIGFNHDDLADKTAYGKKTTTGKAGITLEMENCYTSGAMNFSGNTAHTWSGCSQRERLNNTTKGTISTLLQNAIKKVLKNTAGSETKDDLFLLSEFEIFGSNTYSSSSSGKWYAYYKAGNSRTKRDSTLSNTTGWWLRSPCNLNSTGFCNIVNSANNPGVYYNSPNQSMGISFAFCI